MTKVTNRQHLPALDNSKPVSNPDLLSIADKNYASTILRYSNLAILYSQLDTKDKHIVGAINEINKKVQPAKRVGETDVVGGVIIGDGLTVTEEGVISLSGAGIQSKVVTLYSQNWVKQSGSSEWSVIKLINAEVDLHDYNVLVQPAESMDYINEPFWYGYNIKSYLTLDGKYIRFSTQIDRPDYDISLLVTYCKCNQGEGVLTSTAFSGRYGIETYTIPANTWNTYTHIARITIGSRFFNTGLSPVSQQIIMPLLPTSLANIENNLALQTANLQDAGQGYDWIQLYAENIPNSDVQIRIMFNG